MDAEDEMEIVIEPDLDEIVDQDDAEQSEAVAVILAELQFPPEHDGDAEEEQPGEAAGEIQIKVGTFVTVKGAGEDFKDLEGKSGRRPGRKAAAASCVSQLPLREERRGVHAFAGKQGGGGRQAQAVAARQGIGHAAAPHAPEVQPEADQDRVGSADAAAAA